jgi:hypothetical protein
MMTRYFCTYFDHRYFDRGVAMYESLRRHCPQAQLFVLCLSEECHAALTRLSLPGLVPIALADFEAANPALAGARADRSLIEYYFTCTPWLLDWLLRDRTGIDVLTYLDGDLYFFSDPEPIFEAFERHSTLIIEHRFPPQTQTQAVYGRFNVGWLSFRRDGDGLACLAWWRDRCLEWCYDRLEGDRFADQKYLDRFPELFHGVLVLDHPGANLAVWNMANHRLEARGGGILVDGWPLIFYHFHNFKKLTAPGAWLVEYRDNFIPRYPFLARLLYRPYIRALARAREIGKSAGLMGAPLLKRAVPLHGRLRSALRILIYRDFVLDWPWVVSFPPNA